MKLTVKDLPKPTECLHQFIVVSWHYQNAGGPAQPFESKAADWLCCQFCLIEVSLADIKRLVNERAIVKQPRTSKR